MRFSGLVSVHFPFLFACLFLFAASAFANPVEVRNLTGFDIEVTLASPASSTAERKSFSIVSIAAQKSAQAQFPDSAMGAGGVDYKITEQDGAPVGSPIWVNVAVKHDSQGDFVDIK